MNIAERPLIKDKDRPNMSSFSWEDPFLLADQLDEDERMIAESAHSFCQEKLAPRVEQMYMEEGVDPEIFAEMGEQGILGVTVPEEYGGIGANYVSYGLVAPRSSGWTAASARCVRCSPRS